MYVFQSNEVEYYLMNKFDEGKKNEFIAMKPNDLAEINLLFKTGNLSGMKLTAMVVSKLPFGNRRRSLICLKTMIIDE